MHGIKIPLQDFALKIQGGVFEGHYCNYIFIQESTGLFKVNNPLKPYFSFIPPSLDKAALPNEEPVGAGWFRAHCDKI